MGFLPERYDKVRIKSRMCPLPCRIANKGFVAQRALTAYKYAIVLGKEKQVWDKLMIKENIHSRLGMNPWILFGI